jgi:D-alanine---D-serine ligase
MDKMTVAVLFGGCSTEYAVSLQSAASVIGNLSPDKYNVLKVGITRGGRWLLYGGGLDGLLGDTWAGDASCVPAVLSPDRETRGLLVTDGDTVKTVRVDVAFPVLHGKNGEDGTVQGLCELAGIPVAGCGTLASAVCMDKDVAHRLVAAAGIRVPESVVLRASELRGVRGLGGSLTYPLFVKPANAGSSFGISKVTEPGGRGAALEEALRHDAKVVIEEGIPGFEVGCAVLGNETLTIGEVDEIELSHGFFDYTEKYNLVTSKIHMPARIDAATAERIKATAAEIYRVLGCGGMARVDMFLTPDGEIVFNEVNTIPGFTSHSRYPNMLGGVGLSFARIVDTLVELAARG